MTVILTAANVHDSIAFEELIDAVEPIKLPGRGRLRKHHEKVHADKAYNDKKCKGALTMRGIESRIARKVLADALLLTVSVMRLPSFFPHLWHAVGIAF